METLDNKQFEKVVFDLVEQLKIVPVEYLKKLKNTADIWEIRVQYSNNIFRFLGFFEDNGTLHLNNAFCKKKQKTPKNEINLAEKRKRDFCKRGKDE